MTIEEQYALLTEKNKRIINRWIEALLAQQKESSSQCGNTGEEPKGGQCMRYHKGVWYFRGREYTTLHQALMDAWR